MNKFLKLTCLKFIRNETITLIFDQYNGHTDLSREPTSLLKNVLYFTYLYIYQYCSDPISICLAQLSLFDGALECWLSFIIPIRVFTPCCSNFAITESYILSDCLTVYICFSYFFKTVGRFYITYIKQGLGKSVLLI